MCKNVSQDGKKADMTTKTLAHFSKNCINYIRLIKKTS